MTDRGCSTRYMMKAEYMFIHATSTLQDKPLHDSSPTCSLAHELRWPAAYSSSWRACPLTPQTNDGDMPASNKDGVYDFGPTIPAWTAGLIEPPRPGIPLLLN